MKKKNYVLTVLCIALSLQGLAQISGSVFRDFNGDGVKQTNEPLMPDVIVTAYGADDVQCGTTITSGNSSPNYSLTGCGTQGVRVEFVIPSSGFEVDSAIDYSALSGYTYGTSVRFVQGNSSNVDYALHYGGDYNSGSTNSQLFIPKMNINDPTGGGGGSSSGAQTAFFGWNYGNSGTGAPNKSVNGATIGTTFGTAYSSQADVLFTSAFLRRHSGFGTLGSGGIYKLTPTASSFTAATFYDMDANGHRTRAASGAPAYGNGTSYSISGTTVTFLGTTDSESGSPSGLGVIGSNTARGLATNVTSESYDPAAFDQAGKVSLGGLEISDDGKYLFVVNLYNRRVYRLTLNNPYNPTAVTAVSSYSLPTVTVTNGVLRPCGIKFDRGSLFVGAIGTGENGGANTVGGSTDMNAYVFELENAKGSATFNSSAILTFPLNYRKGRPMSWTGSSLGNEWEPWTNNSGAVFMVSGNEGTYPTPLLSDIEFSDRGDMILSFVDRSGFQWGWHNRRHFTGTTEISYAIGGDLIIAGKNSGTGAFSIENNGSVTSINSQSLSSGAANNQGIGNSEFFKGEFYTTAHEETSVGGVALVKGAGEVVCSVMDPGAIWSGGTQKLSTTTGAEIASTDYQLYATPSGSPATFGKANGLGELEILGEESPVEVGNRVWLDSDADGIQDPEENGVSGVSVELCTPGVDGNPGTTDDVLVASVTTDANGDFFFTTASGTSVTGITYNTSISYDSNYVLKIGSSDWNNTNAIGVGDLASTKLTLTNQVGNGKPGMSDNDGFLSSDDNVVISFIITEVGGNNHDLDFGFRPVNVEIGNYVWLDMDADGEQESDESALEGVIVCLYDNAGSPVTNTLGGQCDSLVTDFGSSTDNDGSISFTAGWSLSESNTYLDFISNEFMLRGTGTAGRLIFGTRAFVPPSAYTVNSVDVCFDARQTGFDASSTDQLQVSYYNGTVWNVLATLDEGDLTGTAQTFCYSSSTVPGLLNIEDIEFRRLNYAFDEYSYISNLNIKFCEATTTVDVKDTTDVNGFYSFSTKDHGILPSTSYEIRIPKNQDTINHLAPTVLTGGTALTNNNGSLGGGGTYVTSGTVTSPTEVVEIDTSFDFGFIPYSLGNVVWWDNDDDGILDAGEVGIPDVRLYLLDAAGNAIDSTITSNDGKYSFEGLLPGDYQVAVMSSLTSGPLDGSSITSVTNTTNDLDDYNDGSAIDPVGSTSVSFTSISNSVTLGNQNEPTTESDEDPNNNYPDNQSNLTLDFGFVPPTTAVGNYIFHDIDSNGLNDGVDTALAAVKVYLYKDTNGDGTPNELIDSVLTDANGFYSFDSLGAGRFRLVVAPDNFTPMGPLSLGSSTSHASSGDSTTDNNSEGSQSGVFTLLPNNELLTDANDGSSSTYDDDDANFTFDFGIKSNTSGGPVPVTWLSFEAEKHNETQVLLTWSTASELNNDRFEVQRSTGGEDWIKIGEVQGAGTTSEVSNYNWVDEYPEGMNYYRIRQIDFDGVDDFTKVQIVRFAGESSVVVYPNPTLTDITVLFDNTEKQEVLISVTDQFGRLLQEINTRENNLAISLENFAEGVYYVSVKGQVFKVIKNQ